MNDLVPVPEYLLNKIKGQVHVAGWNRGATFLYKCTQNGTHFLVTPKTGKLYTTRNRLLFTHRNAERYKHFETELEPPKDTVKPANHTPNHSACGSSLLVASPAN